MSNYKISWVLFLAFLSTFPFFAGAQVVLRIDKEDWAYFNVPNPIDFAAFDHTGEEVSVKAVYGEVFRKDGQLYWIPRMNLEGKGEYDWLVVYSKKDSSAVPLDSIRDIDLRVIDGRDFEIVPFPVDRHSGLARIEHFDGFKLVLKKAEYSFLDVDSIAKILSFDVVIHDSVSGPVDSVFFDERTLLERDKINKVRSLRQGQFLEIKNVKIACTCWSPDNEFVSLLLTKSWWLREWVIFPW